MLLEEDTKLVVCSSIILSVANLVNVSLVFKLPLADGALASTVTKLPIIILLEESMLTDILKSFVHPASGTTIVGRIAVQELLDRQLGKLLIVTRNVKERLGGCSRTKSPTSSATGLVVWGCDFSFGMPIFVIWEFNFF